jgi:1-acyl-sn-glycerol-3-phosphate acyltransferase
MTVLRSLLFYICFWALTLTLGLLGLPLFLLPRSVNGIIHRLWSSGSIWLMRHVLGLDYRIEGLENLPSGACVLASKHQSAWETIVFAHLFWPVLFVLKKELVWLPLFGWALKGTRQIIIDRKGGTAAMRHLLREGKRAQAEGARIPIFPEGTRVTPGSAPPLQPGVVALARHIGLPVVPIALNSGTFWPRGTILRRSGTVSVRIFAPLPPDMPKAQMLATLHRCINEPLTS